MHGPRNDEAVRGLDGYEQMVNAFAHNAKAYWRLWGKFGEPMVRGVDVWAQMQHGYLRWLKEASGVGRRPSVSSPRYGDADKVTKGGRRITQAQTSAKESAREAQRIAREAAERNDREKEADRAPTQDVRSIIRESVRRSRGEV